jgi:hypothetical protein
MAVSDVGFLSGSVQNVGGVAEVTGVFMEVFTHLNPDSRGNYYARLLCNLAIDAIVAANAAHEIGVIDVLDKDGSQLLECRHRLTVTSPPPPAAPQRSVSTPPSITMPASTAGLTDCGSVSEVWGGSMHVYIVQGHVSCSLAREIARTNPIWSSDKLAALGVTYYDWTKGGKPPWTDVFEKNNGSFVIGGIY